MASDAGEKIDLFKELKAEYKQAKKPVFVETTAGRYLMIDGQGTPGGEAYIDAIGALMSMAYTMKFASKARGQDYVVCKMESIGDCKAADPEAWTWTLMIRTPDCIAATHLREAAEKVLEKTPEAAVDRVRLEGLDEGRCVQMLHVGPYDEEGRTYDEMRAHCEAEGVAMHGACHEIYLSDPRRVEPSRLKTILRCPVG